MKSLTIYKQKFKQFGARSKSLQWKSIGASHQRFRQFWTQIDFTGKNVLDVGCGFGQMGRFLTKRYEDVTYKGVDIMPEFIESGHKRYPYLDLTVCDYFNDPLPEKFDTILCSGAINSNVDNNMEFRKKAIATMFEHTTNVLAFNMLGGHPQPANKVGSNIWYADSLEILEYCMSLTRRVVLRHHYHPRDFTIFMYKVKPKLSSPKDL